MTRVVAPLGGVVIAAADVADPVFAEEMTGPGVAIEPEGDRAIAHAPMSGTIVKLHPHAIVLEGEAGQGLLVHLGLDTVKLRGEGFRALAAEGDAVTAGTPLVEWDFAPARAASYALTTIIVALDRAPDSLVRPAPGTRVAPLDPLFDL